MIIRSDYETSQMTVFRKHHDKLIYKIAETFRKHTCAFMNCVLNL